MKKGYTLLIIIITIVLFVFPFYFKTCGESIIAILSLSFTAIGTWATIVTLIIAILLYDKFGKKQGLIEKQTEVIIEIVGVMKGMIISAKTEGFVYFLMARNNDFKPVLHYKVDKNKILLISYDEYFTSFRKLLELKKSYWIPKEIKDKMEFLEIAMTADIGEVNFDEYVRLYSNKELIDTWSLPYPEIKFVDFVKAYNELLFEIKNWLKNNSAIDTDLFLDLK